jgi:hypothetical protein
MTKAKGASPDIATAVPKPAIVVHGTDEHGKPRAARFPGEQLDLVNKAAALMHLQFCQATSLAVAEIAQKLPAGRIYSNGRGFVPNVRRDLYARLLDALAGRQAGAKSEPATRAHPLPPNWEGIEIGHLVLALYDPADDGEGWWEAIVVEKAGDMVTLKWRHEPRRPKFMRHRLTVALLDPSAAAPAPLANQPQQPAG